MRDGSAARSAAGHSGQVRRKHSGIVEAGIAHGDQPSLIPVAKRRGGYGDPARVPLRPSALARRGAAVRRA
ncbi:hypothetical protein BHQ31_17790 [Burkholderia cenocepacia]|nr:hypothetical protein BHQ31_17790 [Burkholderia cenocepacia]